MDWLFGIVAVIAVIAAGRAIYEWRNGTKIIDERDGSDGLSSRTKQDLERAKDAFRDH